MFHLSINPIGGNAIIALLLLLALLLFVFLNPPDRSRKGTRVILLLRILLALLLGVLMFRPSIVQKVVRPLPASLFLLTDQSESMSIADETGDRTRAERLETIVADNSDRLQTLESRFDLRFFAFDRDIVPLEFQNGAVKWNKPIGKESALAAAMNSIFKETVGRRVPGILLFSDGSTQTRVPDQVTPQSVAFRFRDAGIPIYTVPLGLENEKPIVCDFAVRQLHANDRVYKGNELHVSGQVRIIGAADKEISIEFYMESVSGKMEKIDQKTVLSKTNAEETIPFNFVCTPKESGYRKLAVSIPPAEKELSRINNKLETFVKVVDGGLNVLYLEGTRRFEQKFLRLSLAASSEIKVDYRRPTSDTSVRQTGVTETQRLSQAALQRPSLAKELFESGKYNVYILGDLDASALRKEELQALAERVSQGAGLIVLAGERTLAAGGYADSPLKEIFPVELDPADRIPPDSSLDLFDQALPDRLKLRQSGPFDFLPIGPGLAGSLLKMDRNPEKNKAIWQSLPKLDAVYRCGKTKPGAIVLANAVRSEKVENDNSMPLLITHNFGLGRVTVFAADSTWKWQLGGQESVHKNFWRQFVLWSARMDEPPKGELSIELDKSRFLTGEPVAIRILYIPKEGENPSSLKKFVSVKGPDQKETNVTLTDEDGVFSGIFSADELPGDYLINASLKSNETDREIQNAKARFLVYESNPELDNPEPQRAVLENIASITGGRTIKPEEVTDLLQNLTNNQETLTETREEKMTLYDRVPVFWIFLILIVTEWILRKRFGLA